MNFKRTLQMNYRFSNFFTFDISDATEAAWPSGLRRWF